MMNIKRMAAGLALALGLVACGNGNSIDGVLGDFEFDNIETAYFEKSADTGAVVIMLSDYPWSCQELQSLISSGDDALNLEDPNQYIGIVLLGLIQAESGKVVDPGAGDYPITEDWTGEGRVGFAQVTVANDNDASDDDYSYHTTTGTITLSSVDLSARLEGSFEINFEREAGGTQYPLAGELAVEPCAMGLDL